MKINIINMRKNPKEGKSGEVEKINLRWWKKIIFVYTNIISNFNYRK